MTTNDMSITIKPIGVIHSSLTQAQGAPIQPAFAKDSKAIVEVYEQYAEGLKDLEGFSHIILICHFQRSTLFFTCETVFG